MTPTVFAYLLLTFGRKHFREEELLAHPAALRQVANLSNFVRRLPPRVEIKWYYDYARQIESLRDVPTLSLLLEALRRHGEGCLMMDDMTRLFRRVPGNLRTTLYDEIAPYEHHLAGLRQQGRRLGELADNQKVYLIANASDRFVTPLIERVPVLTPAERQLQTRAASRASKKVRKHRADQRARQIAQLRDELQSAQGPLSLAKLADAANARGMTTTRGKLWSRQAVHLALQRVRPD